MHSSDAAARIGRVSYAEISNKLPMTALADEWLFAEDLFGPDPGRDQAYIEKILKQEHAYFFPPRKIRRRLHGVIVLNEDFPQTTGPKVRRSLLAKCLDISIADKQL